MQSSSSGLPANMAGLLCYLLGWISALVFYLIEKDMELQAFGKQVFVDLAANYLARGRTPVAWPGNPRREPPHAGGGIVLP